MEKICWIILLAWKLLGQDPHTNQKYMQLLHEMIDAAITLLSYFNKWQQSNSYCYVLLFIIINVINPSVTNLPDSLFDASVGMQSSVCWLIQITFSPLRVHIHFHLVFNNWILFQAHLTLVVFSNVNLRPQIALWL